MVNDDNDPRAFEGSDTARPPAPAGTDDEYDAPTRVGSLPAALAELMRDHYDSVDDSEPVADEGCIVVREPEGAPPVEPVPVPEPAMIVAAPVRAPISPPPTEQLLEHRREAAGLSGTVRLAVVLGTLLVLLSALYFLVR